MGAPLVGPSVPARVYLAGAIFGKSDADAAYWRAIASSRLRAAGFVVVDPLEQNDYRGRESWPGADAAIVEGDLAMIASCDVVLASCLAPSWGTAMEIAWCRHAVSPHLPCYVIADLSKPISPWLRYHASGGMFADVTDAVEALVCAGPAHDYSSGAPAHRRSYPSHAHRTVPGAPELATVQAAIAGRSMSAETPIGPVGPVPALTTGIAQRLAGCSSNECAIRQRCVYPTACRSAIDMVPRDLVDSEGRVRPDECGTAIVLCVRPAGHDGEHRRGRE